MKSLDNGGTKLYLAIAILTAFDLFATAHAPDSQRVRSAPDEYPQGLVQILSGSLNPSQSAIGAGLVINGCLVTARHVIEPQKALATTTSIARAESGTLSNEKGFDPNSPDSYPLRCILDINPKEGVYPPGLPYVYGDDPTWKHTETDLAVIKLPERFTRGFDTRVLFDGIPERGTTAFLQGYKEAASSGANFGLFGLAKSPAPKLGTAEVYSYARTKGEQLEFGVGPKQARLIVLIQKDGPPFIRGDSGGPLFIKDGNGNTRLAGIFSSTALVNSGDGKKFKGLFYVPISTHLEFLRHELNRLGCGDTYSK
jgi:Trypsin